MQHGVGPFFVYETPGFRAAFLTAIVFMSFGGYFVYDMPGSLNTYFLQEYQIQNVDVEFLYSIYNWPNIFIPFIAGFLVDGQLGRRGSVLVFGTLTFLGQAVITVSAWKQNNQKGNYSGLWHGLLVVGRCIYALGNEAVFMTQMKFITFWFSGAYLSIAFALTLTISRLASTLNFALASAFVSWTGGLRWGLLLGACTCGFSWICVCITCVLDYMAEKEATQLAETQTEDSMSVVDPQRMHIWAVLKRLPFEAWLVILTGAFYYNSLFTFLTNGQLYLIPLYTPNCAPSQQDQAQIYANRALSLLHGVAMIGAFGMEWVVDKVGGNIHWVTLGCLLLCGAHAGLYYSVETTLWVSSIPPTVFTLAMGLSYTLVGAALWPMLTALVQHRADGSAFYCMDSIQHLSLGTFAYIVGRVTTCRDTTQVCLPCGSDPAHVTNLRDAVGLYFICAAVALLLNVLLYVTPERRLLNMSPRGRDEHYADRDVDIAD